jgi:hypothetical protein
MDVNALYYTFSTIPQVLGAIITLLGAFGVFKVQDINSNLKGIANSYLMEIERDYINNREKSIRSFLNKKGEPKFFESRIEKAIDIGDFTNIQDRIKDLVTVIPTPSFKEIYYSFSDLLDKKVIFIKEIIRTLIILAIFTVYHILMIPISKKIENFPPLLIWSILGATFIIVIYCAFIIIKLIKKSFSIEPVLVPQPSNFEGRGELLQNIGKEYLKSTQPQDES